MVMRGVKLNSIKEMKRNFSVDELMYSFCSGELEIWLRKIGEFSVANKVSGIPHNASSLQKLYKVFGLNPVHTEEEIRRLFRR